MLAQGPERSAQLSAHGATLRSWLDSAVQAVPPASRERAAEVAQVASNALAPHAEAVRRICHRLHPVFAPTIAAATPHVEHAAKWCNQHMAALEPWQLVLLTAVATLVAARLLRGLRSAVRTLQDKGWSQLVAGFLLDLPLVRGRVAREQASLAAKVREDLRKKAAAGGAPPALRALPRSGSAPNDVKRQLKYKEAEDMRFADGDSRVSGTVYMAGAVHKQLLSEAYAMFTLTNPMHSDVFPSVRKMEGEVVAMTASILGGGPSGDPGVCGSMTSGGTESILTAVKASRDYMAAKRGITEPEMVVAVSAHAAFVKAAEYFKIRVIKLPVGADYRLSAVTVRGAIGPNTVLVVASAVGFPHGVMDHVEDIAKVTRRRGIPLHVDCCLGGFVLPFARKLGHRVPSFDFSVPGVTSISTDTHKFGMAHKGTSVVLYRSSDIRRHQFTSITDWTGGLYISPGFAGSRSGALIATAWASLVHMGEEGFMVAAETMMKSAQQFIAGVEAIDGLEVVGQPEMTVVAFKASRRGLDIYKVNDLLSQAGWHLNALQRPAALHICLTAAHSQGIVQLLLRDLKEAVQTVLQDPQGKGDGEGMAPLYGMAATVPDRRIVSQFLVAYQDALLEAM
ncbi:hypothetical protein D9Q98_008720 [Chlorella vulgaris]|uniref:sphinganine-1-phosphate aldolase n=1 Tax=Chlorella vulgaris TaxID=3077 RepID=A0A9D4YUH7_CHLVU|nr:hypothetical protein D9Q98_008720 [Chlorella vulgaris]